MLKQKKWIAIMLIMMLFTQIIAVTDIFPFQTQKAYAEVMGDTQAPTAPTNFRSAGYAETTVNFTWDASTDNIGVSGYDVYNGSTVVSTVNTTNCTISNLTPNTSYSFTVKAKDSSGNISDTSNIISITTSADIQAPIVPTNLTVSSVTSSAITISWTASTDNVGVVGYDIYSGTDFVGSTTITNYTYFGLTPNTTYSLSVKAKDAAGNISAASSPLVATTDAAVVDTQAPTIPTNLTVSAVTSSAITVSWIASSDNVGVAEYDVFIGVTRVGTVSETTYTASNLTPNTTYNFSVKAVDTAGNISESSDTLPATTNLVSDTQAPSVPVDLIVNSKTINSIMISWATSTDNVGVTGYKVFRNNKEIGTATTNSFNDTELTASTTYNYTIKAYDVVGNISQESAFLEGTTDPLIDIQAPTAPMNLSLATKTNTSISFAWEASTDNIGVDRYEVFCDNNSIGFTTATNYTCSELNQGTTYNFYIKAYDATGNISDPSIAINVATDDTQPPSAPTNLRLTNKAGTVISLEWDASTDNVAVTGYEIYEGASLVEAVTGSSIIVTGLTEGTSYTFTAKAKDAAGNLSIVSNSLNVATLPLAPETPLNLLATTSANSVTVIWDALPSATAYDIELDGVVTGNITAATYTYSGLAPNTSHVIRVLAKNEGGSSIWSNPITVWTLLPTVTGFVVNQSKNTLTATWTSVTGASSYEIEVDGIVIDQGTSTTYIQSGLITGSNHTYRVRAKNDNGKSNWTTLITKAAVDYTPISGIIIQNKTLTLDNAPYVVTGNLTVNQNVTLSIMPGVVLKFNPGYSLTIDGTVNAIGDAQNKIIFTTSKDPLYGGTGVSTSSDYWKGIVVGGEFNGNYVSVRYSRCTYAKTARGIYGSSNGEAIYVDNKLSLTNSEIVNSYDHGVLIRGNADVTIDSTTISGSGRYSIYEYKDANKTGNVTITNCTITGGKKDAIYVEDLGVGTFTVNNNTISNITGIGINVYKYATGTISIENNDIINNTNYPIYLSCSDIQSSIFGLISNNTLSGNTKYGEDANAVAFGGTFQVNTTITNNNSVYLYTGGWVQVDKTLTIQPGIIIRASGSSTLIEGTLIALGTVDNPIVFTSYKDNLYGGMGVTAAGDYWSGISVNKTGTFIGDNLKVRYAGSTFSGKAFSIIGNVKFTLTNSEIRNCKGTPILIDNAIQPTIRLNSFINCTSYGITNSNPSLLTVDARYNYWDSIYGPNDVIDITSGVIATPWLGSEMKYQFHFGGNTVNPATGNFVRNYTDLTVKSPGFDLMFSRTYNSLDDRQNSSVGKGWSFSFDSNITDYNSTVTMSDGTVQNYTLPIKVVRMPDGSIQMFDINEDGTFTGKDTRNILTKQTDGTYLLTTKDQHSYCYSSNGFIKWVKDRNGNTITVEVDGNGKILEITDQVGRHYTITYNLQGYIETITDPANRVVTYQYDDNLLVRVIDPTGNVSNYSYDSQGFLSEVKDNNLNLIESIAYNHQSGQNPNKVDYTIDKNGNVFTYTYDNINSKTIITDSNGKQTIQWYDSSYCITNTIDPEGKAVITEYTLDAKGNNKYWEEKSITDRNGNKSQYTRDANGNITQIVNPDSSIKVMTYDTKNNVTSEKDENGKFTYYIYNLESKNLIKKVQPLNGTDAYVDGTSDVTKFAITSYSYYSDAEGQQLGYLAKGLLKSVTDPEGNVITYTYDQWGNITTVTDQEGMVTSYTYNIIGEKISEASAKQYITSYDYDLNGRLERTILNDGETFRITYDSNGNTTKEVSPNLYDFSLDDMNHHTYSGDHGYRYTYLQNGRLESVTDPENNITTYTYDLYGNVQTETKPNGAVYRYEYDVMNRMSKVYFKYNEDSAEVLLETYTYAMLSGGKLQKTQTKYIDDNNTLVTIFIYDYAGRLIEQQNPDGTKLKTSYNANGTINNTTDGNNYVTYYKYDGLNRVTEQWIPFEYVSYTSKYTYKSTSYDKAGNKTNEKVGKTSVALGSVPTQFLTLNYTYYKNGKVKSIIDGENRKTLYYYDEDWNLSRQEVFTDASNCNVTEYTNNHFGKPVEKKVHVTAGDINGNDFNNTQDTVLTTSYTYDKNGNLVTVTAPDNVVTFYIYDNLNRQISIIQPGKDENDGEVVIANSTTYNWEGKELTKTDAKDNTTIYSYNNRGFLEKITNAAGGVNAFYYDRAGRTIAEVSPNYYAEGLTYNQMIRSEYTYDAMGRIKTKSEIYLDPVTNQWVTVVAKAYKYDGNGNVIKELEALGYEAGTGTGTDSIISSGYGTIYTYNYANKLLTVQDPVTKDRYLSNTVSYTYDAVGRKTSETNAKGAITNYYYDDAGNITSVRVKKSSSSAEQTISTNTYDWVGNVTAQTDGNGNITVFEYNGLNQVRKAVYPGNSTIPSKTVTYQYDATGNLMIQQDNTGIVDLFTYDNQGRQLSHTQQKQDGSENITTSVKYDKNGNEIFVTDANNSITTNTYDELNRQKTATVTVSGVEQTTAFEYDQNGNQIAQIDWRGNVLTYIYDPLNRVIDKIDAYGKSIEKLEYNHNGVQVTSYDALGYLTQYTYDKNNRLLSTIDPENYTTSQTYDNAGNIDTKKDGKNNTTVFTYDEFNRLTNVKNAKNENTSYTYDLNNNRLTQTDGNGTVTTFEYNVANQVIRKIDHGGRTGTAPSYTYDQGKTESYTYYFDGSLKTKTDRNGNTITYTYDSHGRLITETVGAITISSTYDNNGNQLTMMDGTGTTVRTYDELGRVLSKTVPGIGTTTFVYDITTGVDSGCFAENSTDPKGNVTTKVYDKIGRLSSVTAEGRTTIYEYFDNGTRKSVIYPGGAREDYTYYNDNQVKTLVNKKADGTVIDSYTYNYDAAHNMTSKVDGKGTTSYTYDTLNRLLTVTEPDNKTTTYAFDTAGNRTSESVVAGSNTTVKTYSYNTQNRLTGTTSKLNNVIIETRAYSYDNNGNELTVTKTPYLAGVAQAPQIVLTNTYDKLNQLITSVTSDGKSIINTYNGEGYRVEKSVNGQVTRYLYEYDKVVLETDGAGNLTARNVYGINLLMRDTSGEQYFYMYNAHADVTALLKPDGTIAGTYYYDAFGNITEQTGTADNNINYAGYQYDKDTGLYYLNARMYDPKIARFIQEDDISYTNPSDPLTLNLYTYCANEPIKYTDPNGHWFGIDDLIASGVGAIVGLVGQYTSDVVSNVTEGKKGWNIIKPSSSWETYTGAAAGGVAAGETMLYTANPVLAGLAYGGTSTLVGQGLEKATGKNNRSWGEVAINTAGGTLGGGVGGATFMFTGNPVLTGASGGGIATGTSELLQKAFGINNLSYTDIMSDTAKSAAIGGITGGFFGVAGKVINPVKSTNGVFDSASKTATGGVAGTNSYAGFSIEYLNSVDKATGIKASMFGGHGQESAGSIRNYMTENAGISKAENITKVRNGHLANDVHPVTKVPFDCEGFPKFDVKFNATLDESMYRAKDSVQFKESALKLNKAIQENPELAKQFTPEQLKDITKGRVPEDYTWHHNQQPGLMQLVDETIHAKTGHTGGRSIWGGGSDLR